MTQYYTFTGPLRWVKIQNPDEWKGVERWKCNIVLEGEELQKYQESGCQVKERKNSPNEYGFSKTVLAPKWHDPEKHPSWDAPEVTLNGEPFDGLVGNDSIGEVTISVYDTSMGKGHRLEKINILDLIGYTPDNEEGNSEPAPVLEPKIETPEVNKEPW